MRVVGDLCDLASADVLIWLYLFGIATFFSGSFAPIEIVLTIVIGGCSAAGIRECVRMRPAGTAHCIAAAAVGAVLQIAATWISFTTAA